MRFGAFSYGGIRERNEDYYEACEDSKGFLICVGDGMGGYDMGCAASRLSVEAITAEFKSCKEPSFEYIIKLILKKFEQINSHMLSYSEQNHIVMGTTLSVVFIQNNCFFCCNVGDTSIYKISGRKIKRISMLHNVAGEEYESGNITYEQYCRHPKRNILTQCIGINSGITPYTYVGELKREDCIVICTDGVHNYLSETELQNVLSGVDSLEQGCKKAVEAAVHKGSTDNLTVAAVKV
jgi:protein phosphatase